MIKNLIFDVGNVLLEYRWHQMLLDYGLTKEEAAVAGPLFFDHETWKELDLGNMPVEDVICLYEKQLPQYAGLIRWFLTHLELMPIPRPDVWEKVHALKEKGYKIYLLSNYNEDFFRVHTQDAAFLKDIDGKVVSYEIHKIKPYPEIYQYLLDKYSLKPEESVFFDDRPENTQTAQELGMKTYTITSKEYLLGVLDEFLK
jgi:putative hydrolase of the HAD superfamily